MDTNKIYDMMGIGIGPFNLGLAALLQDHPNLSYVFVEQKPAFDWHPGLLLPWTRMQVPYYADLVTLANPQSPFSYMNYLHVQGKMFRFGVHENPFPLRTEYNNYCKWVASALPGLLFNRRCDNIVYDVEEKSYKIEVLNIASNEVETFHAKHLVIGTGTVPFIPSSIQYEENINVLHSSAYLKHRYAILAQGDVTIIGSGQSAAEIFYDLLQQENSLRELHWYTSSRRIQPMDYSRFALEMSSPDYVDYFYNLPEVSKKDLLATQQYLYKGINEELITQIHDHLYYMNSVGSHLKPVIQTVSQLKRITAVGKGLTLSFRHTDKQVSFTHRCKSVILATGYEYKIPAFLDRMGKWINRTGDRELDIRRNYSIDINEGIFVQNADLLTHGFNAADLGLGVYRNMVILNAILNQQHYKIERDTAFQCFDPGSENRGK